MKKLKYSDLINSNAPLNCPELICTEMNIIGYRFVYFNDVNNFNFLPNYLLDEKLDLPPRKISKTDNSFNCSNCGISLYDKLDCALTKYESLPKKFKENYQFTHIGVVQITEEMGLVHHEKSKSHINFFEYENVEHLLNLSFLNELK